MSCLVSVTLVVGLPASDLVETKKVQTTAIKYNEDDGSPYDKVEETEKIIFLGKEYDKDEFDFYDDVEGSGFEYIEPSEGNDAYIGIIIEKMGNLMYIKQAEEISVQKISETFEDFEKISGKTPRLILVPYVGC